MYIVEDGKLVEYERTGECCKCGDCCHNKDALIYIVQGHWPSDEELKDPDAFKDDDWSAWEGYSLIWAQGIWWYFKMLPSLDKPQYCEAYDPDTCLCTCFDDKIQLPAICTYWPFRESDMAEFPNCTFKFNKKETIDEH